MLITDLISRSVIWSFSTYRPIFHIYIYIHGTIFVRDKKSFRTFQKLLFILKSKILSFLQNFGFHIHQTESRKIYERAHIKKTIPFSKLDLFPYNRYTVLSTLPLSYFRPISNRTVFDTSLPTEILWTSEDRTYGLWFDEWPTNIGKWSHGMYLDKTTV